ncbi:MAG: MaoC/PaaZ C-terminal domain-containing protein [Anaerolineales bacterium]
MDTPQSHGLFFEQFETGMEIKTLARTVTEADIVRFAGLSGDFNRIHTDAEYAAGTPFGQRVAHGLLVAAIASGLAVQTRFLEDTILAFREIAKWKFSRPVYIGDTVHVALRVAEKKALPRLGGGSVNLDLYVKNQRGETVQQGRWVMLVQSAPEASSS